MSSQGAFITFTYLM